MGTFLFTNILLLKEKKHGRAKSCSPMPKGSRHSSQRVPTLSGNMYLFPPPFTLVFRRCLPRLFSSSFPLSNLLTHERAAIILFGMPFRRSITTHPSPTSAIRFQLHPCTFGYTGTLPCRANEPSGCVHRYLCQRLSTKTDCSTFLGIRHLSLTGDVLSAFSYVWPARHCRPMPMLVVSLHQQRTSPYIL